MTEIFSDSGALSRALSSYEAREQQSKLAEFIEQHLAVGGVALAEAGTGTGKTLAYLFPLALHCTATGGRGAVSTETKNLQTQLLEKDIPLLQKILKDEFSISVKVSLCMGSNNYFCRRRFLEMASAGSFPLGCDQEDIQSLFELSEKDGIHTYYKSSVPRSLWNEACRVSDYCNGIKCSHYEYCSFTMAREEWKNSDLLIMNHHLFFANIALSKGYLPKFDNVIFDEAHNLEQIACEQLGFILNESFIREIQSIIHHRGRKDLFASITDAKCAKSAENILQNIDRDNAYFFSKLKEIGAFSSRSSERMKEPLKFGDALIDSVDEFLRLFDSIKENCDNESPCFLDFTAIKAILFQARQALGMTCGAFEKDWAYWIEYGEKNIPAIKGLPLDISSNLRGDVYEYYESVTMISATLSVNGSFQFLKKSLGIDEASEIILGSPFNYDKNMLIYMPPYFPNPGDAAFTQSCAHTVDMIAELTGGNTLALFTSYEALKNVKKKLENLTEREIFSQADSDAHRAMALFKKSAGSILLGTHSFWQGIDLPGDMLRSLVITRLPFLPPERPDVEAKIEMLEKRGINPFSAYQLPLAVIKFRQGLGRLIRSKTDKGIVAILDPRITTKSYGKLFHNELPGKNIARDDDELEKKAKDVT